MTITECCLKGFKWNGSPVGREDKLADLDVYITGDNADVGILVIPDLFGWAFPNIRLLADHYAQEANATVYVPDFFHGEALDVDLLGAGKFDQLDLPGFMTRHGREVREPELFACARALREKHAVVGAVGYCYGGWAVFRLGAREHQAAPLVDFVSMAHPSLLTDKDIDEMAVPVQLLMPEVDAASPPERKSYLFVTLQKLGVPFDYQHFPGVEHACMVRGSEEHEGEREAMTRGKDVTVSWIRQWSKRSS